MSKLLEECSIEELEDMLEEMKKERRKKELIEAIEAMRLEPPKRCDDYSPQPVNIPNPYIHPVPRMPGYQPPPCKVRC